VLYFRLLTFKNKIKMRKVLFKTWIPAEYIKTEGHGSKLVEGTNCWSKGYSNAGYFHQWANAYEEFESGAGNYTVAIIELSDGKIVEVLPSNVMFVDAVS
jgi:hypothetical protein